jgi:general secretion pathway protein K
VRGVRQKDGYALVMVIWAVVFLIIVSTTFVISTRLTTAMTRNLKEKTISYSLALRGYNEAIKYLLSDKDLGIDFIDEKGTLYLDTSTPPLPKVLKFEEGISEVEIIPEDSKVNLNYVQPHVLRRLFQNLGYEPEKVDEMVDSLKDWIDPDDAHRLNGAEDEYYREFGYTAKNDRLDTVYELVLIKGFGKEVVYGTNRRPPLYKFVTTFGKGGVNINVASVATLKLLGVTDTETETIMSFRRTQTGGMRSIPSRLVSLGFTKTASSIFRINVTGRYKDSGIGYNIQSVVKRTLSQKGFEIETLYWREDVKYTYTQNK